jgi:transcriptional regulator with XRE-family HTH domain
MVSANSLGVKELIEALQDKHRYKDKNGVWHLASLRDLAEIYGESHQNLSNWKKGMKKQSELLDFIEKARKGLGLDPGQVYRKIIKSRANLKPQSEDN